MTDVRKTRGFHIGLKQNTENMKNSNWKRQRFKLRFSYLYLFFVFVSVYITGSAYWILTDTSVTLEFADRRSCPVCFGESLCHTVALGRLAIPSISRLSFFEKAQYPGTITLHDGTTKPVVVKRLAQNYESDDLENRLCSMASSDQNCHLEEAMATLAFITSEIAFGQSLSKLPTHMFVCPSVRLINRVLTKHLGTSLNNKQQQRRARMMVWSTANLNAEPLMLQSFPRAEQWPFPTYYGACGRISVAEDCGSSLANYYNSPWTVRASLALQLLQIADRLSQNGEDYGLYMMDVNYDTFSVNDGGNVTLVDLQHILVVDKQAVRTAKPAHWDDVYETPFTECNETPPKSCHQFSETQLCAHVTSDHNFYVICRYILMQTHDTSERDAAVSTAIGLLHDMPDVARNDWDLEYLLNECVMPTRQRGRFQVIHKLIEALTQLQTVSNNGAID